MKRENSKAREMSKTSPGKRFLGRSDLGNYSYTVRRRFTFGRRSKGLGDKRKKVEGYKSLASVVVFYDGSSGRRKGNVVFREKWIRGLER